MTKLIIKTGKRNTSVTRTQIRTAVKAVRSSESSRKKAVKK